MELVLMASRTNSSVLSNSDSSHNGSRWWIASLLTLLLMLLVWLWFATSAFPGLFEQLYHANPASPVVNLQRYPLERYLEHWGRVWPRITVFSLGVTMVGLLVCHCGFRRWVDAKYPSEAGSGMPRRSLLLANCAILIVLLGQGVDTLISREHWPFSHYPMYTGKQGKWYSRVRIEGLTADGTEINLRPYFVPLSTGRISSVVMNTYGRHPEAHYRRCAQGYYEWYQKSREEHRHDGPAITAVRLYQLRWRLRELAENHDAPEERILLSQYPQGTNQ